MTDGQRRAVLYARKSRSDEGAEQSKSIATQLKEGREYATKRGWTVVGEFSDDGKEGTLDRSKRKGLDAALTLIESDAADAFVTLWYNRLSRDALQWFGYLDVLDRHKAEWHVTAEGGLVRRETAVDKFQVNLQGLLAVLQRDTIRDNWKRAHKERIEAGLPKSRSPRFGYRWDPDAKAFVIHDAEADAVRELYRRYTRGEGFTQLVKWLNDTGWRVAGTENPWSVRTLNRFMDNGFAAGFISREDEYRDLKGAHEPIITETAWLAYRAERERRAEFGKKASGAGERWWLAGIVKCGQCGGPTYVDSFKRPDGKSSVMCSNRRSNPDLCKGVTILRAYVEDAVGLWLGGHLDQLDALANSERRATANAAADVYQAAVAGRDKIIDGLADLEESRLLGDIEPAVYRRTKERLTARLHEAERAVKEAAASLEAPEADTTLLRGCATEGKWNADGRAALRGVLDRVEVGKDALTILPVTGEPVTVARSTMHPRCKIGGCDKRERTKGLCTSHTMRARNLGILDELAERVAASVDGPGPTVTVEQVDALFASAAAQS